MGIGATRPDEKRWGRWSNDDSVQAQTGSRQPGAPAKSITAANRGWMARKILSLAGQVKCFFLTSPFIEPAGAAGVEPVQLGQEREDEPPPACQPLRHGS